MDVLRQHEIAEAGHRILNPFTDEKLALVGELCRWRRGRAQWWTVARWLDDHPDHPDHPDAPGMRDYLGPSRRAHLAYGRRYLGWGVFVLRPAG